jgi:hypothetical protein
MRPLQVLILFFIFSLSGNAAIASEEHGLVGKNSLWRSEYQLAKTRQIYLLLNLPERKILIKVRGVVLKELPMDSCSQWGAPLQPRPFILLSKSAIMKPKRAEVKPPQKDDEKNPSIVNALQVGDMPARYRLNFDGGIRMYVRPKSEGALSTVLNLFSYLKSNLVTRPIGFLWNELHGENFTEISVYLNEKDARSLYWAFQEGFSCIIWANS